MEQSIFPVTAAKAEKKNAGYSSQLNRNALFPCRLRKLREEKGISQAAFAEILNVSKSTVSLWENGDTLPAAESLYDMAKYYDVSSDYLLCLTDHKTPNVTIQAIIAYTGLNERAVSYLHTLVEVSKLPPYAKRAEFFSEVITDKQFDLFLALLMQYVTLSSATTSLEYSTTAEYSAISDVLKQHGYTIALPDQQAQTLFSERITNIMRNILDRLVEEKSDGND